MTELLRRCKNEGINTALESESCVPCRNLELVMPYIDLYLTDIKIIDEQKHIEMTGASNKQILENLRFIGHTCRKRHVSAIRSYQAVRTRRTMFMQ